MPHFADMVYQLGGIPALAGIPFHPLAKYYFVDATNGSDGNDGRTLDKSLATIAAAEAKCVANHHDTVFLVGISTNTLSAALDWDKNYTHLIGICAPTRSAKRARIFQLSSLTNASPLLNITASGCIFKNFYVSQGVADTGSLRCVGVTSCNYNYFEDVHMLGGGNDTNAIDGACSLYMNGAGRNTFKNCTFGGQNIAMGTGGLAILFGSTASGQNFFEDCYIKLHIDHANAALVELTGQASVDRMTVFKNCLFYSGSVNQGTTMASAFVIPVSHSITARILLINCAGYGFADWDASARNVVYLTGGTQTAGGYTGLMQVATV